jgi:hypothetical protein
MLLLLSGTGLGIYAAPISMLLAFLIPSTAMLLRSQLGNRPIDLPYAAMLQATAIAVAIAVGFHFLHPAGEWTKLGVIAILMLIWFASLFVLRIIPSYHWHPIRHIALSAIRRGSALQFDSQAGLGSLEADDRQALRAAVIDRLPPAALVPSGGDGTEGEDAAGASEGAEAADGREGLDGDSAAASEGARLVRLLRQIGRHGGVPLADRSELDAAISLYLFSNEPVAVRLRTMRQLLSEGVDAHELRTLEDLRNDLAKASQKSWDVKPAGAEQRRARDGKGRGGNGPRPRPSVKRV